MRERGSGCGPATLKTPRGRFSIVRTMASTTSSSWRNWKSGSKPSTIGTRLPRMKLASVPCPRGPERVADAQDARRELGEAPEGGRRVEVGGDEVGQLGEAVERERRLVLHVEERRVGPGAVEGVAADEDAVLDAVGARVLEDGARPAEVDLVALLARDDERRHRRHVHDDLRARLAEHVLGGALADVDLVELDGRDRARAAGRCRRPRALRSPSRDRHLARDRARGARDEDAQAHGALRSCGGLAPTAPRARGEHLRDGLLHLVDVAEDDLVVLVAGALEDAAAPRTRSRSSPGAAPGARTPRCGTYGTPNRRPSL